MELQNKIFDTIKNNQMKFEGKSHLIDKISYNKYIKSEKELKKILKTMPFLKTEECCCGINLKNIDMDIE